MIILTGVVEQLMATDVRPQDNRHFTDTNTAQKLTEDDIRQMKEDGKGGQAIIQARGLFVGSHSCHTTRVLCFQLPPEVFVCVQRLVAALCPLFPSPYVLISVRYGQESLL